MQYRDFGKLDFKVSALGFGTMRLPVINNKDSDINEEEAIKMIRYAIDNGVNYVDTSYYYHGGNSERLMAKALSDGYREKVKLVTKLHPWCVKAPADFDKVFDEQMERMQTNYVDFYLLHSLWREGWDKLRDFGVLKWAEKLITDGKIRYLGFSFHDHFPVFKEIIDAYDNWIMCQIQYNFMNEDVQAGTKGLEYAAEKGLAVAIMEPLYGGLLANPPEAVQKIWDEVGKNPVDTALQWLWSKPEVSVVLSGMSTMEQVIQNLESANTSQIDKISQDDLEVIKKVRKKYDEFLAIPCTKCQYCMPCPQGVDIPRNFELYNEHAVYSTLEKGKGDVFYTFFAEEQRASSCIGCKLCEEKCPQNIRISEWMPKVHEVLGD